MNFLLRHRTAVFVLAVLAQGAFGTYYSWTEFNRGQHFDPFLSPSEFQHQVVEPSAKVDIPAGDIEAYVKAAHSIATRGNYTLEDGRPSAWVTPGYPLLLAFFFKIFGFHFWSILALNMVAWALAFGGILKISKALGLSKVEELIAALLFAGNLRLGMFVGYAFTECVFVACCTVFLAFFLKAYRGSSMTLTSAIGLGTIAGFGSLVRPILLAPALLLLGFALLRRKKLAFAAALVIALLPMSFWIGRNSKEIGYPIVSSSSALAQAEALQDFHLTEPIFTIYRSSSVIRPYGPIQSGEFDPHPELNHFFAAKKWSERWKESHSLGEKSLLLVQRIVAIFSPYIEAMSPRNQAMSFLYWLLFFPTALLGIYLFRQSMGAWMVFSTCFLLIFLPAFVLIGPSLRYQIPGQVCLAPLAAVGIGFLFARIRKKE